VQGSRNVSDNGQEPCGGAKEVKKGHRNGENQKDERKKSRYFYAFKGGERNRHVPDRRHRVVCQKFAQLWEPGTRKRTKA